MKFSSAFIIVAYLLLYFMLGTAFGQHSSTVYLHKTVAAPFTPQDAFFLIENAKSGATSRQRGVLVPINAQDTEAGKWLVGAKVSLAPDTSAINFSIVLVSKDNRYFFVAPESINDLHRADLTVEPSQLKDQLRNKLDELRSLEATSKTQTASLNRLRSDAEIIGNFNQIFSARDETDRLLAEIRGLDNDIG
jgi:hypothetical protein